MLMVFVVVVYVVEGSITLNGFELFMEKNKIKARISSGYLPCTLALSLHFLFPPSLPLSLLDSFILLLVTVTASVIANLTGSRLAYDTSLRAHL